MTPMSSRPPALGAKRPRCARLLFGAPSRDELDHFLVDQGVQQVRGGQRVKGGGVTRAGAH
jgi:hypothetical protein